MTTGPSWVGIGAQRSGTTWFTDLVTRHPDVGLGSNGKKEQHFFDGIHVEGWSSEQANRYRSLFSGTPVRCPGEFTPSYLRQAWIPRLLAETCPTAPLLVVLLRDPVDRFLSALRWSIEGARNERAARRNAKFSAVDAQWGGMYATQLAEWRRVFPAEQFLVVQYEVMAAAPASTVTAFWKRLGLEPAPLGDTAAPSPTSTEGSRTFAHDGVPGLVEVMTRLYRPEVDRLVDEWGVIRDVWTHFA